MRICLVLALLVLLPALAARAQTDAPERYRWVDGQGHTHIADQVPADAVDYGYDVLNSYGRVLRHVDGLKTPEQIAAAKRAVAAKEAALERRKHDRRLLLSYPNEAELVRVQETQESMTAQRIEATRINMKSQLNSLAGLLDQAAELQHNNKSVPKHLRDRIAQQRETIGEQRRWISKTEAELVKMRSDNAATLEHYRALANPNHAGRDDGAPRPAASASSSL